MNRDHFTEAGIQRLRQAAVQRWQDPAYVARYRAAFKARAPRFSWKPLCSREQFLQDYVHDGLTMEQMASKYGCSVCPVRRTMRHYGIPYRKGTFGRRNRMWKGDEAGYVAFHQRVNSRRGTPSSCAVCGRTDTSVRYEWANLTGNYQDPNDFERMCAPCHARFDAPKRRKPTPIKFCASCGKQLERKMRPNGRIEPPAALLARRFCDAGCAGTMGCAIRWGTVARLPKPEGLA